MEWMPTFFIVYRDGTMGLFSFLFTIKSTLYRKVLEIAEQAREGKMLAVIFIGESYYYKVESLSSIPGSYNERVSLSEKVMFTCDLIGKSKVESYSLNLCQEDMEDNSSIVKAINKQLEEGAQNQITFWSMPIQESLREAFSRSADADTMP